MADGTATQQLDRIEELLISQGTAAASFYDAQATAFAGLATLLATTNDILLNTYLVVNDALPDIKTNVFDILSVVQSIDTTTQAIKDDTAGIATTNNWLDGIDSRTATMESLMNQSLFVLEQVNSGVSFINSTLGAGDGPPNDIIGILRTIAENTVPGPDCACASSKNVPEACEFGSSYTSTDVLFIPGSLLGGLDFNVAVFNAEPPDGIEYGSVFGVPTGTELYSLDWEGWKVFVASEAPLFGWNPLNPDRYPTNEWLSLLGGEHSFSFIVDDLSGIKVYLCPPSAPPTEPPPFAEGGTGLYQSLITGSDVSIFDSATSAMDMRFGEVGNFYPAPNDTLGYTLYFYVCANQTTNVDTSLYLGTEAHNEGSIFLEVPVGTPVPWTVVDYEQIYVYTWLTPAGTDPMGSYNITWAWTEADAIAACTI